MLHEIMKKLMPSGPAFEQSAPEISRLLQAFSCEYERVCQLSRELFQEVPGHLHHRLRLWIALFGISAQDEKEADRIIAAKLAAVGGQSPDYLLRILQKYSPHPEKVRLIPVRSEHLLKVYGADVDIRRFRCGERSGKPLRCWTRNEVLIRGFEAVKHAETIAEYYDGQNQC